jgi:hypothetical protein
MNDDPAKERIIDYLHLHNVRENDQGFIRCLWHDDKTPSMSFHLEALKFHCFGCGENHDIYDFAAKFHDLDVKRDFAKIKKLVYQELGLEVPSSLPGVKSPGLVAIAEDALPYVYSNERLKHIGRAVFKADAAEVEKIFPYRNAGGEVEYIECRYPAACFPDGKKKVLSLWFDGSSVKSRGCPVRLYNRDKLAAFPDLPVVIHEGAKCAEAAGAALPAFVHTAYNGGGKKLSSVDLSPLKGRKIYIYPDDDRDAQVGIATARKLKIRIKKELGIDADIVEPAPEARSIKPDGADIVEALEALDAAALEERILNRHLAEGEKGGADFYLEEGYRLHEAAAKAAGVADSFYRDRGLPGFFTRDGAILVPEEGKLRTVGMGWVRTVLSEACRFYAGDRQASPPLDITAAVYAGPERYFRPIDRIIPYPVMTASGRVITERGYDDETRCWYDIPELPGVGSAGEARDILDDFFVDFPFMEEADRTNLYSMLLTFILRPRISGPVPAFLVQAPVQGTGKTKLVTVALSLLVGDRVTFQTFPRDETEVQKTMGGFIMAGYPYFFFDNVKGKIRSDFIEAMVTGKRVSFRIVGKADVHSAENNFVFIFTSNNPSVEPDLTRRIVPVNLDANRERPDDTAGIRWRHPDIEIYAVANRGRALAALLRMAEGAAENYGGAVKGGFESWSRVVGASLEAAGCGGFLSNAGTVAEDDADAAFYGFVEAWVDKYGEARVTSRELLELAEDAGIIPDNSRDRVKSLGRVIRYRVNRIFSGYKIMASSRGPKSKMSLFFYLFPVGLSAKEEGILSAYRGKAEAPVQAGFWE